MGGVWERLVASTKRALRAILGGHCETEDVLQTVLAEVEFVINNCPLTYVSADIRDAEPLTPSHFRVGQPEAALPPGVFTGSDTLKRDSHMDRSISLRERTGEIVGLATFPEKLNMSLDLVYGAIWGNIGRHRSGGGHG